MIAEEQAIYLLMLREKLLQIPFVPVGWDALKSVRLWAFALAYESETHKTLPLLH